MNTVNLFDLFSELYNSRKDDGNDLFQLFLSKEDLSANEAAKLKKLKGDLITFNTSENDYQYVVITAVCGKTWSKRVEKIMSRIEIDGDAWVRHDTINKDDWAIGDTDPRRFHKNGVAYISHFEFARKALDGVKPETPITFDRSSSPSKSDYDLGDWLDY